MKIYVDGYGEQELTREVALELAMKYMITANMNMLAAGGWKPQVESSHFMAGATAQAALAQAFMQLHDRLPDFKAAREVL